VWKEAVAVAVSRSNRCPYCVDAHAVMLSAASASPAADAIRTGRDDAIADPALRQLVAWAAASGAPAPPAAPFGPDEAPEIVGTAVLFHYINRLVSAYLPETPLPSRTILPGLTQRLGGRFFARALGRAREPGASLAFLPDAPVADDLAWARPMPHVAGAFARLAAATDAAGDTVSPAVRARVLARLDDPDAAPPGLSRRWLDDAVAGAAVAEAATLRPLLVAALAPWQMDAELRRAFVERFDERTLLGALAWASFAAARRIGARLGRRSG
jgi:AhpD family alkylhydroperoxidase